ncbi:MULTISPECIES: type II toxin-antitoxin system RelE/ParE family toxin [unclassified Ruminococcus]|uniref:type II toxin-antitoxin system RelE/ParE family toxin n=1 Tax=unclassified Ruminococcus TaxID=2608920 RepID=UPI00319E1091
MEYKIIFYEKENHETPTLDFLEALRIKAQKSKNARIQYKQAVLYIELLKKNGTFLPENITKHIEENIWELRPGNNRIFYFFHEQETFILLHTFMKKATKHQNVKY